MIHESILLNEVLCLFTDGTNLLALNSEQQSTVVYSAHQTTRNVSCNIRIALSQKKKKLYTKQHRILKVFDVILK